MRVDVVFAGLGGQGLMTMGQILALAAMREGKMTSYLPSYSPEVRGGWANCTVVVSDRSIGSPIVGEPSALVAMEASALRIHAPTVKPGGLILVNNSLATEPVDRNDIRVINIPANEIAGRLGNERVANIIMLGAYVTATDAVSMESLQGAIRDQLTKRPELVGVNMKALAEGAAFVSASALEDV
jgi:2-oxoglutarate ferredoxin oxidoreductase subunit gamma